MNRAYITGTILIALDDRKSELAKHKNRAKENIKTAYDDADLEYWMKSFTYWSKQIEDCEQAKKFICDMS